MAGKNESNGQKQYMRGKDLLWKEDGSIYHLGVKEGELFNKILTVGDHQRAEVIAKCFDKDKPIINLTSSRNFKVISGYYKGVGISIVGIGMGAPMADFFMREASAVLPNKTMYVIRLGTCGAMNPNITPGTLIVCSKGSLYCMRNYSYFDKNDLTTNVTNGEKPYIMSNVCTADKKLSTLLYEKIKQKNLKCVEGLNVSGETFYATQGRKHDDYEDENKDLLDLFAAQKVDCAEMESHMIFHLAKHRKTPCYAAAAHIALLNRVNPNITHNVTEDELSEAISKGGMACLEALAEIE